MQRQVIIPIEMTVRELEAKVLLSAELAQAGFQVILAPKHAAMAYARNCSKAIFTSIWAGHKKFSKFYEQVKSKGNYLVAIDEEAFVTMGSSIYSDTRLTEDALRYVDLYLCLGEWDKELLRTKSPRTDAVVVGNPRVDALVRKSSSKQKDELQVLFVSPFGFANHFIGGRRYLDQLCESNVIDRQDVADLYERYLAYQSRSMKQFLNFAKATARENPSLQVRYRCHPAENPEVIKKILNGSGVELSAESSLLGDLTDASLIVHNFCTVGIEAQLLGKKTLGYAPELFGVEDELYVYRNSELARDEMEGLALVSKLLRSKEKVAPFIGGKRISIDKDSSSKRIASLFLKKFGISEATIGPWGALNFWRFLGKEYLNSIFRVRNDYFEARERGLNKVRIESILEAHSPDNRCRVRRSWFLNLFYISAD